MLKFFLASLIVGSGVIFGAILSIIAKEELRHGKKYFMLLKNIMFISVIITASIFYINTNYLVSLSVLLFLMVLFIKRFQLNLIYASFAVICLLSDISDSSYLIISSLIFFAGFPVGSLATYELAKKEIFVEKKILTAYFIFVFILLLRLIFYYLSL